MSWSRAAYMSRTKNPLAKWQGLNVLPRMRNALWAMLPITLFVVWALSTSVSPAAVTLRVHNLQSWLRLDFDTLGVLLLFIAVVDCSSRTTLFWYYYFLVSRFSKKGLRADISDNTFLTLPIQLLLNNWHTGWRELRSTMNDCGEEKVGEEKIYA